MKTCFIFSVFLAVVLFMGWSKKTKNKNTWNQYFLQEREETDPKYIRNGKFWISIKPDQNLTIKAVVETIGSPKETEKVVLRTEGEGRAEILTLHKYNGVIFVESDISPNPGTVVKILFRRK